MMLTQIITIVTSILIIIGVGLLKKQDERLMNKVIKVLTIIYFIIVGLTILLPDGLIMSVSENEIHKLLGINKFFLIIRSFKAIILPTLVISIFFDNKYFKNLLIFICLPTALISLGLYHEYMNYYLMETGKGLNSIPYFSQSFKAFLISPGFRSVIFGIEWGIVIVISVVVIINHFELVNTLKEIIQLIIILCCLLIQFMPIYLPQLLYEGFSNIIFDSFELTHFLWMIYIVLKIGLIYLLFRKKSNQTKFIVCLVLALALLIQYNSMFSLTISIKRLPFQLCNIASYLMIIALITKNKHLFNFNLLVNVLGAFLALLLPDVNGRGIFEVWNMHFIYEHTNIIVIPILCLLFGIFNNLNKESLKDAMIGFSCYFVFCAIIGITFNIIAVVNNNNYFEVNYLFMFDMDKALDVLPFLAPLTKITISIKNTTFYPLIMLVVYFGYSSFVIIFYLLLRIVNHLFHKKHQIADGTI